MGKKNGKMEKRQYEKYVVSDINLPQWRQEMVETDSDKSTMVGWLSDDVVKGAFHVELVFFLPGVNTLQNSAHTHDFDEVVGFYGSDANNPHDLNGEVEFWLEDEQYIINKSTMFFAPKGLKHCPMVIRRVDKPIFHFTIMLTGKYTASNKASA